MGSLYIGLGGAGINAVAAIYKKWMTIGILIVIC